MRKLTTLHRGLARVRRFRSTARIASALAIFVSIVLWVVLGAFLLDVVAHMGRLERAIVLVLFAATTIWAFRRFVWPALSKREEEVSLALMVERQQGIGSDLVAALQFSDSDRPQFGSQQLRETVVDHTDDRATKLDYLEGFSREEMFRRLAILAVTIAVALVPVLAYPDHTRAFFNRFLLGSDHYPTDTLIGDVVAPGETAIYGRPVDFKVRVDGVRPDEGSVRLQAVNSGVKTTVTLSPDEEDAGLYVGELSRALDDLTYSIHIGDAYTEPATLKMIPLPMVEVDLQIETPEYAKAKFASSPFGRQRVALEGSRITPVVTANKKISSATIAFGEEEQQTFALTGQGDKFTLDSDNTPFANVRATVRYDVQVIDEDGISLDRPISGTLQVRADQPPRIGAATATQFVLPTASPRIKVQAIDDYALDRIVVHKSVIREQATDQPTEITEVVAKPKDRPGQIRDTFAVDLKDLNLEKGDRVTIIFEAFDYRGGAEGKSSTSESIVFQVTDRAGILASMRQFDTQMDKKLDQIIKAQLGIGDSS